MTGLYTPATGLMKHTILSTTYLDMYITDLENVMINNALHIVNKLVLNHYTIIATISDTWTCRAAL